MEEAMDERMEGMPIISSAKGGGKDAVRVALHPLAIVSMSEHYTRMLVQSNESGRVRIAGAILGAQDGLEIEIWNAVELVYDCIDGIIVFDPQALQNTVSQYKEVFPTHDFLGWYASSSGLSIEPGDMTTHKNISEGNESPFFLLIDPTSTQAGRNVPIALFDSELHVIGNVPTLVFANVEYTIETQETERVAVDQITSTQNLGVSENSAVSSHLVGIGRAVEMLVELIELLCDYLDRSISGEIPRDLSVLRQIACVCSQLPRTRPDGFQDDFFSVTNDAMLTTYLASVTKTSVRMGEMIDHFNATYQDKITRYWQ